MSEKKGYPYGWYPLYGRAVDWSWVAGRMLAPRMCPDAECSCPVLAFGDPKALVRLNGFDWADLVQHRLVGKLIVLFGKQGDFTERDPICKPNYDVQAVQSNPAR